MDRGSVGGAVRSDVVRILELMKQHDAHKKSGHEALRTIVNTLAHQMFVDGDDWGVLEGDAHIMDLCGRKLLLKIGRAVQSLEKSFARIVRSRRDHLLHQLLHLLHRYLRLFPSSLLCVEASCFLVAHAIGSFTFTPM